MAEQTTRIRLLTYSHESTWNSAKTVTAASGATTTVTSAASLTDTVLNKYQGSLWKCTADPVDGTNLDLYRKCDGFDPTAAPTADTAYFQGDEWAGAAAINDTFSFYFVPRIQEGSIERNDVFGERNDYHRDSFDKFPDVRIRTEADVSFVTELTGMGFKATQDAVAAAPAPAPSTTTFSVTNGSDFSAGQSVLIDNATDGLVRRYISSVTTNAIVVTPAMTNAPTAGDKVWGLTQPGEIGNLLSACVGSVVNGGGRGDLVAASANASTITVADGTQFAAGQYIGVDVDAAGTIEWTQVTNVATHVLTVSPALSSSATAADRVYNTFTVQPADASHEPVTFEVYEDAVKHVVNGAKGTFSIDGIETDELPKVNFSFISGGNETLSDLAIPADFEDVYVNYNPPIPVGSFLQIAPTTAITPSEEFRGASFELGSTMSRRYSPKGAAGITEVSLTEWDSPTITCQINMDTLSSFNPVTAYEAGTLQRVRLILGGTPGRTVVIDFRQAQTKAVQAFQENDGREYWEVTFEAKNDASSTLPAFVIALG